MSDPEEPLQATPTSTDSVVVLAVTAEDAPSVNGAESDLSLDPARLAQTLAELRDGAERTGIASVDAALDRLTDLDPTDLAGSAEILADVLRRLESTMEQDSGS